MTLGKKNKCSRQKKENLNLNAHFNYIIQAYLLAALTTKPKKVQLQDYINSTHRVQKQPPVCCFYHNVHLNPAEDDVC